MPVQVFLLQEKTRRQWVVLNVTYCGRGGRRMLLAGALTVLHGHVLPLGLRSLFPEGCWQKGTQTPPGDVVNVGKRLQLGRVYSLTCPRLRASREVAAVPTHRQETGHREGTGSHPGASESLPFMETQSGMSG